MNVTEGATTAESFGSVSLEIDLCKACGICIAICPATVYERDDLGLPVVARQDDCTACLLCELHCPDFAIEIERPRKRVTASSAAHAKRVRAAVTGQTRDNQLGDEGCGTHGEED